MLKTDWKEIFPQWKETRKEKLKGLTIAINELEEEITKEKSLEPQWLQEVVDEVGDEKRTKLKQLQKEYWRFYWLDPPEGETKPLSAEMVKEQNDLVSFLQKEGYELRKAGQNWMMKCPFHSNGREKKPSFTIYAEQQSWYCFSCSTGGDIITFIQKIENITFREALRMLQ